MDVKKINDEIFSTSSVAKKDRQGEASKVEFQKVLEDVRSNLKTGPSSVSTSTIPSAEEVLLHPAYLLQNVGIPPEIEKIAQIRAQGIKGAESTLDLLDEYQKALGDPNTSLKKVDRLVGNLSQEVNHLDILSEKLPSSDPLQKIMKEIGILSAVEIEKFKRGEYI